MNRISLARFVRVVKIVTLFPKTSAFAVQHKHKQTICEERQVGSIVGSSVTHRLPLFFGLAVPLALAARRAFDNDRTRGQLDVLAQQVVEHADMLRRKKLDW